MRPSRRLGSKLACFDANVTNSNSNMPVVLTLTVVVYAPMLHAGRALCLLPKCEAWQAGMHLAALVDA